MTDEKERVFKFGCKWWYAFLSVPLILLSFYVLYFWFDGNRQQEKFDWVGMCFFMVLMLLFLGLAFLNLMLFFTQSVSISNKWVSMCRGDKVQWMVETDSIRCIYSANGLTVLVCGGNEKRCIPIYILKSDEVISAIKVLKADNQ